MDRYKFYRNWYLEENNRKIHLENALNIPIVVATAIVTALFFLSTHFNYTKEFLSLLFITFLILSIISLIISIFFLIRAFNDLTVGFGYMYLADPNQVEEYYQQLQDYYSEEDINKTDDDFNGYLIDNYIQIVQNHHYLNNQKSGYLHQSKRFLTIAIIAAILTTIPYMIVTLNKGQNINQTELKLEQNDKGKTETTASKSDKRRFTTTKTKTFLKNSNHAP